MRALALLASFGLALSATPAFAQAAAQPPAPAAGQPPAVAAPAPAPGPAPVFPVGPKFAYVQLPLLSAQSADGKLAAAKFQAEQKKKSAEAEAKAKKMAADQQRLESGGTVMSAEARATLEKDIERQQREGERFEQDAQAELNELQQQLQNEYNKKLFPVLEQLSKDYQLLGLFSAVESGLIWADPGLDLTQEAVKRMDAAPTPKPTPAAAPPAGASRPPAATPPASTAKPPAAKP
jgi:outer membrane protein